MLDLLRQHRAAVVCSIVASFICVYFLEPILALFGRSFLKLASLLGTAYVDRIYAEAAILETPNIAFFLMLVYFWVPVLLFLAIIGSRAGRSFFVGISSTRTQNQRKVSQEERTDLAEGEAATRSAVASYSLNHRVVAGAVVLISVLGITGICLVNGATFVQLGIISSFKQHIRILAPYVGEDVEKRIVSDWSRMSTQSEYAKIRQQLHDLAKENGILLPSNKIYPGVTP